MPIILKHRRLDCDGRQHIIQFDIECALAKVLNQLLFIFFSELKLLEKDCFTRTLLFIWLI